MSKLRGSLGVVLPKFHCEASVDGAKGVARFDGRSLAIPDVPHTLVPEAGGPAAVDQTGPYAMTGQAWQDDPTATPPTRNAFTATLSGARAVTLAARRMRLNTHQPIEGDVTTAAPLQLTVAGRTLDLPAGHDKFTLAPRR